MNHAEATLIPRFTVQRGSNRMPGRGARATAEPYGRSLDYDFWVRSAIKNRARTVDSAPSRPNNGK
jgi:hypothetical protein